MRQARLAQLRCRQSGWENEPYRSSSYHKARGCSGSIRWHTARSSLVQKWIRRARSVSRLLTASTVSRASSVFCTRGRHSKGHLSRRCCGNPLLRLVAEEYITARAASELTCSRELRLVGLHGRGLSRVGLTNAISTGPYAPCWAWSDYLWSHQDQPDGIAYTSRHNPHQICFAIFERPDIAFVAGPPTAFSTVLPSIKRVLRQYDKIMTRA